MRSRARHWVGAGRVALLPPAAFAVHQLRYELAYGPQASVVLRETGHSYLHSAAPWLVAVLALSIGGFLLHAGRSVARRVAPRTLTLSFGTMWLLCVVALVAIFACQETLEGFFAVGHPQGWSAVFGDGGWWAIPAAACVGLVLATLFHGAVWAVRAIVERRVGRRSLVRPTPPVAPRLRATRRATPAPLLAGWSSRGPPR